VFKILQHLKALRGTPIDVFGMTAERKMERRLITEYQEDLLRVLPRLEAGNLKTVIELASLPDGIRGYGPVKLAAAKEAAIKRQELLAKLFQ